MHGKAVVYYTDRRGQIPAFEFLRTLSQDEREKAYAYVEHLKQRGELLRRPISEYLGEKIYELRPKHIRILYGFVGSYAVLLHAFRKMTDAVPERDKQLARIRLADAVQRYASTAHEG